MMLYDRNFVIAISARLVIGAEVDDERMTWRKGWSIEGVSNVLTSGRGSACFHEQLRPSTYLCSPSAHFLGAQMQT